MSNSERAQVGSRVDTAYGVGVVTERKLGKADTFGVTFPVGIELAPDYIVDFAYFNEAELGVLV